MNDSDKPDAILKQVPLIRNPVFQPPNPITLNANYNNLISNLPRTVKPPKLNMTEAELQKWIDEIQHMKGSFDSDSETNRDKVEAYNSWVRQRKLKVAPGFDEIIKPRQSQTKGKEKIGENNHSNQNVRNDHDHPEHKDYNNDQPHDEINQLDQVFGKATINE